MGQIDFRAGSNRAKVQKVINGDPMAPNKDIAAIVGCSHSLVSQVRSKMGINIDRDCLDKRIHIELSPENAEWLMSEAQENLVPLSALIDGIVTDARLAEDHPCTFCDDKNCTCAEDMRIKMGDDQTETMQ